MIFWLPPNWTIFQCSPFVTLMICSATLTFGAKYSSHGFKCPAGIELASIRWEEVRALISIFAFRDSDVSYNRTSLLNRITRQMAWPSDAPDLSSCRWVCRIFLLYMCCLRKAAKLDHSLTWFLWRWVVNISPISFQIWLDVRFQMWTMEI